MGPSLFLYTALERLKGGLGGPGQLPGVWVPKSVIPPFCPGEAVEKVPLSSSGASLLMGWKTTLISPQWEAAEL